MEYFPFEKYTFSCDEQEYSKDLRKKNYLIKYTNLLLIDNRDFVSLRRFTLNAIFFRNTFSKEAFIEFFLDFFSDGEKRVLSYVVFDIFVRSKKGEVGEYKNYLSLIVKLQELIEYDAIIIDNWKKIKQEMPDLI